jgi:hypothetical protein
VAIAKTEAPFRAQSYKPFTRWSAPGPEEPITATGRPETCESAPAANAPASSLRTLMKFSLPSLCRMASMMGFAESPTMP